LGSEPIANCRLQIFLTGNRQFAIGNDIIRTLSRDD
jgi:hypothetical protein